MQQFCTNFWSFMTGQDKGKYMANCWRGNQLLTYTHNIIILICTNTHHNYMYIFVWPPIITSLGNLDKQICKKLYVVTKLTFLLLLLFVLNVAWPGRVVSTMTSGCTITLGWTITSCDEYCVGSSVIVDRLQSEGILGYTLLLTDLTGRTRTGDGSGVGGLILSELSAGIICKQIITSNS